MTAPMACRSCESSLHVSVLDLGSSPLANSYLSSEDLSRPETFYPLEVFVCDQCLLVQLSTTVSPVEIFTDYAYFSSYSESWVEHARRFAESAIDRFSLGPSSLVVEIASNDGYLLRHFDDRGIPILGIEPAGNVAAAAEERGVPTLVRFFDEGLANELRTSGRRADLLVGNNVLAQVPGLNDFVSGLKTLLADDGVVTIEVPHILELLRQGQFDTIYHEHYSYFSLTALLGIFSHHGLRIFDVDELPTHGGSLRLYAAHDESEHRTRDSVAHVSAKESEAGLDDVSGYRGLAEKVERVKCDLLAFLIEARRSGRRVIAYGAPAKGNTLLNFCGIRRDLVGYTVDRNPHKQGRFLPGSRIPIVSPDEIDRTHPDFVLILPWNLRDEITAQMARIRQWGGKFAVAVPELEVLG